MQTILIATHNPAKLKEIIDNLEKLIVQKIKIISLKDLKITKEPKETGKNFAENSLLKAKYYAKISGLPTIADDGGIEIDVFNGEPGVNSKRWLGYDATDKEIIDYLLYKISKYDLIKRTAHLKTCITFFDPKTNIYLQETEEIDGKIANKLADKYQKGFPYRALFIVDKYQKYYDELSEKEHYEINHRIKALKKLEEKIINLIK